VSVLGRLGAEVTLVRPAHAPFATRGAALVVTVGGDGTLLAASHHVAHGPILGVNSSPGLSVGFFCAARRRTVGSLLARALAGRLRGSSLARMQVSINGRVVSRRVLNDALFCHASPAATSRYLIEVGRRSEEQRSSGLWVGPAAGSTAAQRSAGGRVLPLGSRRLQLVVREAYRRSGRLPRLLRALARPGQRFVVRCKMQDARLFLDGPHVAIPVRLGDVLEFTLSSEPITVLGLRPGSARRR
jgi:NAD+ kinase